MGYTGGYENDVPLLQPIPLRPNQVFHVTGIRTADDLIKQMTVQIHHRVGIAGIVVGIDIGRGHLHPLVDLTGLNPIEPQICVQALLLLGRRWRTAGECLSQFVNFHKMPHSFYDIL